MTINDYNTIRERLDEPRVAVIDDSEHLHTYHFPEPHLATEELQKYKEMEFADERYQSDDRPRLFYCLKEVAGPARAFLGLVFCNHLMKHPGIEEHYKSIEQDNTDFAPYIPFGEVTSFHSKINAHQQGSLPASELQLAENSFVKNFPVNVGSCYSYALKDIVLPIVYTARSYASKKNSSHIDDIANRIIRTYALMTNTGAQDFVSRVFEEFQSRLAINNATKKRSNLEWND